MMRSILIGSLLGALGIGGVAVAQQTAHVRPDPSVASSDAPDGALIPVGTRAVPKAERKSPPGAGGGPDAKKGKKRRGRRGAASWPEGTSPRVKRMHHLIVKALELSPEQAKELQELMVEQGPRNKSAGKAGARGGQKGAPGARGGKAGKSGKAGRTRRGEGGRRGASAAEGELPFTNLPFEPLSEEETY